MLLFFQSPLRAKQCRACVCEQEHVPPSDLESSWQHHQTFMRETGRLWRTVQAQGYREREREAGTESVSSQRLSGLVCINRELLLFYGTLFCVCEGWSRWAAKSSFCHQWCFRSVRSAAAAAWFSVTEKYRPASQCYTAASSFFFFFSSILSWEIVGRWENHNPKYEMNICDSAHRVGCFTLRM